jgi:phospholipase C
MSAQALRSRPTATGPSPIKHVVIIFKENHTFDNYFGTFPGANGITEPRSPNPPPRDPNHTHAAWLTRDTTSVRQQFVEQDIPAYFDYARKFTLCDSYFTDVAGPSTPNHLMVVAADSPVIDNPSNFTTPSFTLPASLPLNLEKAGRTWRSYGGFATKYLTGINPNWKVTADQFKVDAQAGNLPDVSWVFPPGAYDEHPPDPPHSSPNTGNVTVGMQWTKDQIAAMVAGGLWPQSAIFITWDDWGGWYDHVNPPDVEAWNGNTHPGYKGSQFRYGSRVPCLVLGPYAKSGYISKVLHSHVSLLKFCEETLGVSPVNTRDGSADGMSDCFDFTRSPLAPP